MQSKAKLSWLLIWCSDTTWSCLRTPSNSFTSPPSLNATAVSMKIRTRMRTEYKIVDDDRVCMMKWVVSRKCVRICGFENKMDLCLLSCRLICWWWEKRVQRLRYVGGRKRELRRGSGMWWVRRLGGEAWGWERVAGFLTTVCGFTYTEKKRVLKFGVCWWWRFQIRLGPRDWWRQ